jgi:hypothetical protein
MKILVSFRINFIFLIGAAISTLLIGQDTNRQYSSGFGFSIDYPASWTGNIAGDMPLITAKDLDPPILQSKEKRISACLQKIYVSKQANTPDNLIIGVLPSDCMGAKPELVPVLNHLDSIYVAGPDPNTVEHAEFEANAHHFYFMRSHGPSKNEPGVERTSEYVATEVPKGILYLAVVGKSRSVQDFDRIRLKLNDGVSTELLPPTVKFFAGNVLIGNRGMIIAKDTGQPHHFKSELGFEFDYADGLVPIDPDETQRRLNEKRNTGSEIAKKNFGCSNIVGMATTNGFSMSVSVLAIDLECMGYREEQRKDESLEDKMDAIGKYGITHMRDKFDLENIKASSFHLGTHPAWGIVANATYKNSSIPPGYLARVLVSIKGNIVEFIFFAVKYSDLELLLDQQLKLGSDIVTAAFPADAIKNLSPIDVP